MSINEINFKDYNITNIDINLQKNLVMFIIKNDLHEKIIIIEKKHLNDLDEFFEKNKFLTIYNLDTKNLVKGLFFNNSILLGSEKNKLVLIENYNNKDIEEIVLNLDETKFLIDIFNFYENILGLLYYDYNLIIYEIKNRSIYLVFTYPLNNYFSNIMIYNNYIINFSKKCVLKNFINYSLKTLDKYNFEDINFEKFYSIKNLPNNLLGKVIEKLKQKKIKVLDQMSEITIWDYVDLFDEISNLINNKFFIIFNKIIAINTINNKILNIIDLNSNEIIASIWFEFEIKKLFNLNYNNLILVADSNNEILIINFKIEQNNIIFDVKYKICDLDSNLKDFKFLNKNILLLLENEKLINFTF